MTRILLFTGKGGVGKTTCAAATALRAAASGLRTLVCSSDPAHSLADALDRELGPEPVSVAERLDAQEIDLYWSMQHYWANLRDLLRLVARWQGVPEIAAEELAALPGMGEGSALLWLDRFYHERRYDLIVVDSAPTGETLTFLTLPQATEWWLTRAFPFQRLAMQTVGYAVRKATGVPLDRGYAELRTLFERLQVIHKVLADPDVTSIRVVLNPERMVIREARRAWTYLQVYGYGVDAVIVNRVVPATDDPAWSAYLEAQAGYLEEIAGTFAPLPILTVPHRRREVFGMGELARIADDLYGGIDPCAVLYRGPTLRIEPDGDDYLLHLPFPGDRVTSVTAAGDRLVVTVGGQRRTMALPSYLSYYRAAGHVIGGGRLTVRFVRPAETAASPRQP